MKKILDLNLQKESCILILICVLVLPLWFVKWNPLKLEGSSELTIKPINQRNNKFTTSKTEIEVSNRVSLSPVTRKVLINPGDTLMKIFTNAGLTRPVSYQAIISLSKIFNPKNILPGQEIEFVFKPDLRVQSGKEEVEKKKLNTIIFRPNSYHEYTITPEKTNGFRTKYSKQFIKTQVVRTGGQINSSLYLAATKSGLPNPIIMEMIRIYSWDIDFQRSIRSGDKFEILYERKVNRTGNLARYGNILYANLKLGKISYPLFFFRTNDKRSDYYDNKGHSARKPLMRTPINGARLSSGYGTRRHPILGFNKMHRGVDFAAPRGTPVLAAGAGTIIYRARNGSYGNYIRIRHNSRYSTAYGHLSKFNRRVTKGSRVRQGQIIGYVGTTGRSTGPHLHYEILVRGRQTNPMRVKMPSGRRLTGMNLKNFRKKREKIRILFLNTTSKKEVAQIQN